MSIIVSDVPFDEWLAWTENLQREFGIRVDTCKIAASVEPGLVRLEAIYAPSGR